MQAAQYGEAVPIAPEGKSYHPNYTCLSLGMNHYMGGEWRTRVKRTGKKIKNKK